MAVDLQGLGGQQLLDPSGAPLKRIHTGEIRQVRGEKGGTDPSIGLGATRCRRQYFQTASLLLHLLSELHGSMLSLSSRLIGVDAFHKCLVAKCFESINLS